MFKFTSYYFLRQLFCRFAVAKVIKKRQNSVIDFPMALSA